MKSRKKPNSTVNAAFVALILVVGLLVGSAVTLFVVGNQKPNQLQAASRNVTAPVSQREFADEYRVEVQFTSGVGQQLISPMSGRVIRADCAPGSVITSGNSNYTIEGSPVINLSTSIPLWRDINLDSRGADVLALQEELIRLGYSLSATGVSSTYLINIVSEMLRQLGDTEAIARGYIPVSSILWLPTPELSVAKCDVAIGQQVTTGETLGTLPASVETAVVSKLPSSLAPGERVLVIDDAEIAVSETGEIGDPQGLAKLAETNAYLNAVKENTQTLSAVLRLATPVTAAVVPPAALYQTVDNSACVLSEDTTYSVTILGSELGSSFIDFGETPIPESVTVDQTKQLKHPCG